jgi:hypothetical protein
VMACQYLEMKGVYKNLQMTEARENLQLKDICEYRPLMHSYKYP